MSISALVLRLEHESEFSGGKLSTDFWAPIPRIRDSVVLGIRPGIGFSQSLQRMLIQLVWGPEKGMPGREDAYCLSDV